MSVSWSCKNGAKIMTMLAFGMMFCVEISTRAYKADNIAQVSHIH
jgi:hypothetical protein